MEFFTGIHTLEELKKEYHRLAMEHHPDLGGDPEIMKKINNEYDRLFELVKNTHVNAQGEKYHKETTETPDDYKGIIEILIHFTGCIVEICGSWIWVSGNTRDYAENLKALHFRFSAKKQAWYFTPTPSRKRKARYDSMEDIRNLWGSTRYKTDDSDDQKKIA